jgi:predicted ATPase
MRLVQDHRGHREPQRQLAFLRVLHDLTAQKIAQFVIATHSPMLLTFPGATIFSLDAGKSARSRTRRQIISKSQGTS